MKNICFFNHWHNGDVFAGKGWMQAIQQQCPDVKFAHAQVNKLKTMQDLDMEHIPCSDLPDEIVDKLKFAESDNEVYLNTWIGSWGWDGGVMPQGEEHANWPSLHRMFDYIGGHLNYYYGQKIEFTNNPLDYVPTTDWSKYDIAQVDAFVAAHPGKRLHLFCNGVVRSTQTNLDDLKGLIEEFAEKHPDDMWICTASFETELPNIVFTDDILSGVQGGDINEIAYLSTKCNLIVGKNSGPFMFTHVRDNMWDDKKVFVALSHRASDCYPYNCNGIGCHYFHSGSDSLVVVRIVLNLALSNIGAQVPGSMISVG